MEKKTLLEFTNKLIIIAQEAGTTIMKYHKELNQDSVEYKLHSQDLVTEVDRIVEKEITGKLMLLTPEAQIVGEEMGKQKNSSPIKWIIDPIDGTRYFARRLPMFSTTIGMTYEDEPQIGIINIPFTQQTFYGFKGGGSYLDGKKLKIPKVNDLNRAIVYVDIDNIQNLTMMERKWVESKIIDMLGSCYRVRMFGASSIAATWLTLGAINGFIDITGCNPVWDMVAPHVIMSEAGAKSKLPKTHWKNPRYIAAQPELLNSLLQIIHS